MNVSHTSTYNLDWRLNEERVRFNARSIHHIPQTWASNENKKMINLDKRKRKIWIKMLLPSIVKLVKYVTRDIRPHHTCVSIVNSYNELVWESCSNYGTFHSGAIQQSHLFIMILLPYISCLSVGHIEYIWLLFSYIEIYIWFINSLFSSF